MHSKAFSGQYPAPGSATGPTMPRELICSIKLHACWLRPSEVVPSPWIITSEGRVPLSWVDAGMPRTWETGEWIQAITLQIRVPQCRLRENNSHALDYHVENSLLQVMHGHVKCFLHHEIKKNSNCEFFSLKIASLFSQFMLFFSEFWAS